MENWLFDGQGLEFHHFQRAKQAQNQAETNRLLREQNQLLRRAEQESKRRAQEAKRREHRAALPKCCYCSMTLEKKEPRCPACGNALRWRRCEKSKAMHGGLNADSPDTVLVLDPPLCPSCGGVIALKAGRCSHCTSSLRWDGGLCFVNQVSADENAIPDPPSRHQSAEASFAPHRLKPHHAELAKYQYVAKVIVDEVAAPLCGIVTAIKDHLTQETSSTMLPPDLHKCVRDGVGAAMVDLATAADILLVAAKQIAPRQPQVRIAPEVEDFLWGQFQVFTQHRKDFAPAVASRNEPHSLHAALSLYLVDRKPFGGSCPQTENAGMRLVGQSASKAPSLRGLHEVFARVKSALERVAYIRS